MAFDISSTLLGLKVEKGLEISDITSIFDEIIFKFEYLASRIGIPNDSIIEGNINQSNYKNKYINIGFRKSFQKLVANILKSEDQKKILSTDIETIKSLVQNYRIIEEKVAQEKYKMKISVSFKEEAINEFFNNKGSSDLMSLILSLFVLHP